MIRLLASSITVSASISDTDVVSAITNLGDVVPSKALAKPLGLIFTGSIPSDLTVKKVLLRSTKDSERVYRVYEGAAVKLADLKQLMEPDASATPISIHAFNPDHGLELVLNASNGTTAYTADILWKVGNAGHVVPGSGGPLPGESVYDFRSRASGGLDFHPRPGDEKMQSIIPRGSGWTY